MYTYMHSTSARLNKERLVQVEYTLYMKAQYVYLYLSSTAISKLNHGEGGPAQANIHQFNKSQSHHTHKVPGEERDYKVQS